MNWTLQFYSHNLAFLYRLISLGKLKSIPLLNMHLRSSISLPRPKGSFSFSHLLTIIKSQIRPSLEYCSYVWGGAPISTLCLLDKVQSKAIRLIKHPNLTKSLQPLSHRRLGGDLSIYYRNFNGHCSQEIRDIIPVPLRRVRTRSSIHSHSFQVSLPISRTLSQKSSFIPRTCNSWNVLPSPCFPESHNVPSFKSKINKLDLITFWGQDGKMTRWLAWHCLCWSWWFFRLTLRWRDAHL